MFVLIFGIRCMLGLFRNQWKCLCRLGISFLEPSILPKASFDLLVLSLPAFVCDCVRQPQACPRHNSSQVWVVGGGGWFFGVQRRSCHMKNTIWIIPPYIPDMRHINYRSSIYKPVSLMLCVKGVRFNFPSYGNILVSLSTDLAMWMITLLSIGGW